ncbi:MAG: ABC transporter ATP-binding protein [candidate division Zixibacteria bacterium]|nr:ABC transporter ATP-binding protein [candidate division Zixibacteria bacterium]
MTAAITFDNLSKVYGRGRNAKSALKGISFEVQPGEIFGFLGPNGAGKTTAIHVLLDFLFPTAGRALIFGIDSSDPQARRNVGFLPEVFAFDGFLTGRRFLKLFDRFGDKRRIERAGLIAELLQFLDMSDAADIRIKRYSKGMTQKIGLAQALAGDPKLLVLDEPTSGMDPVAKAKIKQLFLKLKSEGKTIFLSSHILADIEDIADRVAIIHHGELLAVDRISELQAGRASEGCTIVFSGDSPQLINEINTRAETEQDDSRVTVTCRDRASKEFVLQKIMASGGDIIKVTPVGSSLTSHFLKIVSQEKLADD